MILIKYVSEQEDKEKEHVGNDKPNQVFTADITLFNQPDQFTLIKFITVRNFIFQNFILTKKII